jgi:chromosome segregation ATPase
LNVARNAGKAPGSNGPTPESTPESLDQVRDILFGGQMRMVDARLQGLENRVQQEQASMRSEFTRELADVDATMKKSVAQLNDRLTVERTKRAEDLKALSSDLKELLKNLERRHQTLEEAASQADAELRDHLLRQSTAQSAELTQTADRLAMQMELMATALQTEKLDTASLATGLTDLVSRLTGNGANAAKRAPRG